MLSNMPPGYSEDGNAATHGSELLIYHDLMDARSRFTKWMNEHRRDFPSDEFTKMADEVDDLLDKMRDELNQPL